MTLEVNGFGIPEAGNQRRRKNGQTINIRNGDSYSVTGLIYLEAGKVYQFSGYADDSMHLELGGKVIRSTRGNAWGDYRSDEYTAEVSGYYTLEMYVNNVSGPGDFSLNLAVDGGQVQVLNAENYSIFGSVADLVEEGAGIGAFVAGAERTDGGYFAATANSGIVGGFIDLPSLSVSSKDTLEPSDEDTVLLHGLPDVTLLTDGQHIVEYQKGMGEISLKSWDLSQLKILPPDHFVGSIDLTFSLSSSGEERALSEKSISVDVVDPLATGIDSAVVGDRLEALLKERRKDSQTLLEQLLQAQTTEDTAEDQQRVPDPEPDALKTQPAQPSGSESTQQQESHSQESSSLEATGSRYQNQVIVQLGESEAVQSAASHLYQKHSPEFSRWLKLENGELVDAVTGQAVPGVGANSRVVVVGHGAELTGERFTLGGYRAHKLAELLASEAVGTAESLDRISLVACGVDDHGNSLSVEKFATVLMHHLQGEDLTVNSITARTALVQVDPDGRKLTGKVQGNGDIIWSRKDDNQKIVVEWQGETIVARTIGIHNSAAIVEGDVPEGSSGNLGKNSQIMTDQNPRRIGLEQELLTYQVVREGSNSKDTHYRGFVLRTQGEVLGYPNIDVTLDSSSSRGSLIELVSAPFVTEDYIKDSPFYKANNLLKTVLREQLNLNETVTFVGSGPLSTIKS